MKSVELVRNQVTPDATVVFCPTQQWWQPVRATTAPSEVIEWIFTDAPQLCDLAKKGVEVIFLEQLQ